MGVSKREEKNSSTSTSPCSFLRSAYHNCFNKWYSEKFVKGQWDKEECASEWQKNIWITSISVVSWKPKPLSVLFFRRARKTQLRTLLNSA
ncbi:hypothetical protein V6N13_113261 [Hibiscus sabdariffa]